MLKDKIAELELQLGHATNQISILENNTTKLHNIQTKEINLENELQMHDLEASHDIESILNDSEDREVDCPLNLKIKNSHPSKKTPKKSKTVAKAKTVELVYPKTTIEESNLFLELNSILINTLNMTIPVLFSENSVGKDGLGDTSFISMTSNKKLEDSIDQETLMIQNPGKEL